MTETIYRKQLRPVIQSGAIVMDRLFESDGSQFGSQAAPDGRKPGSSGGGTGL